MTIFRRASGVLFHPTSLPGRYGIGDLGPAADEWISFLQGARQQLWQILPLGPTGFADSPYQCFSAFAGNPYLVSPDRLMEDGLITPEELETVPNFPAHLVDFGPVIEYKVALLQRAAANFQQGNFDTLHAEFDEFAAQQADWLEDYALFMALKDAHAGAVWNTWAPELVARTPAALADARRDLATQIGDHRFRQFIFFRQWRRLKQKAAAAGISIIGDIPIFVAYDSADVWQHPELFELDDAALPMNVAGVPPDYFAKTGQLWGNPLYRWDVLKEREYAWWIKRFRTLLELVDIVRLDHFRGFDSYWAVPYGNETAEIGEWLPGPGTDFFATINSALGDLPIIAEDLGFITNGVQDLRDSFGLPGLKILQFAFGAEPHDSFLPHNYTSNFVVFSGTHDNDTTVGWYTGSASEAERDFFRRYLSVDGSDIAWDLIRAGWASVACMALAPLQDILSLGTEARMNLPGTASGNWRWRYEDGMLTPGLQQRLCEITEMYGRTA